MLERFNLMPVIRGHWKSLTLRRGQRLSRDVAARIILVVPSAGLAICTGLMDWHIRAPAALLSGVALLAGSLLGAFSMLFTLRLRLTDRPDDHGLGIERDGIDESVSHLLLAILFSLVDATFLVVGMNVDADSKSGGVHGLWAVLPVFFSVYIVLLFTILIPKLYYSYVAINRVRSEYNGFDRTDQMKAPN